MNSRAKGARREREFASLLREHGFAARRGQQFAGGPDSPDVVGVPGWHIEVKGCEKVQMRDWVAQAEGDSKGGKWFVAHKWNDGQWLVTMKAADLLPLLADSLKPHDEKEEAQLLPSESTASALEDLARAIRAALATLRAIGPQPYAPPGWKLGPTNPAAPDGYTLVSTPTDIPQRCD